MQYTQLRFDMADINSPSLSLQHLEIASDESGDSKKSLKRKAAGKFYTPPQIGKPLVSSVLKHTNNLEENISIMDPFSGDGRLVVWFLEQMPDNIENIDIHLWDYDEESLEQAKINIERKTKKVGVKTTIHLKHTNTYTPVG